MIEFFLKRADIHQLEDKSAAIAHFNDDFIKVIAWDAESITDCALVEVDKFDYEGIFPAFGAPIECVDGEEFGTVSGAEFKNWHYGQCINS